MYPPNMYDYYSMYRGNIYVYVSKSTFLRDINIKVTYCSDPEIKVYEIYVPSTNTQYPFIGSTKIGNTITIPSKHLGETVNIELMAPIKGALLHKATVPIKIYRDTFDKSYNY